MSDLLQHLESSLADIYIRTTRKSTKNNAIPEANPEKSSIISHLPRYNWQSLPKFLSSKICCFFELLFPDLPHVPEEDDEEQFHPITNQHFPKFKDSQTYRSFVIIRRP